MNPEEDFVKEAYAEITEMEKKAIEGNAKIQQLLSGKEEKKYALIHYGGVEIRFKPFVGRQLRHKMMKAKKELVGVEPEDSLIKTEHLLYTILGELCVDEPFNDWKTWSIIDEKGDSIGGVQRIFMLIMAEIGRYNEDVKNFR